MDQSSSAANAHRFLDCSLQKLPRISSCTYWITFGPKAWCSVRTFSDTVALSRLQCVGIMENFAALSPKARTLLEICLSPVLMITPRLAVLRVLALILEILVEQYVFQLALYFPWSWRHIALHLINSLELSFINHSVGAIPFYTFSFCCLWH